MRKFKALVILGVSSMGLLIGTFRTSNDEFSRRVKRSVNSDVEDAYSVIEVFTTTATGAPREDEEGRQKQGGLSSIFRSLGFGSKNQLDPYLLMLMEQLRKEKAASSSHDDPYDDVSSNLVGQRKEEYGGSYGASSYGGSSYGGGGGYGGGSSYGSSSYGGGYGECCGQGDKLIKLLALGALALLGFYLYLRTTTTAAGRRRRRSDLPENDIEQIEDLDVTLDGPAWLSMIHELWQQDGVADDPSCAYHTLCRMNRIAAETGGQGTWAAHLSSVPLSYLLHRRHDDSGFFGYMDAAMMGKSGANCSALFSNCSRLH